MVRLSSAALATAAFVTTTSAVSTQVASGFVASDDSILFALNIPQSDDNNDLYFTMQAPDSASWMAVGMGNDKMDDTLMFMAYSDSTGKNITLSPRLSYGHTEPSYTKNISVSVLPGSGIANGNMTVNAMCSGCRQWKGGSIDPTNTAAKFIFATGPGGSINSNSGSANIKRHASYGAFTMDLTKAFGAAGVPVSFTADTSGTVQTQDKTDHDFSAALHACIMILTFVGLMPVGVLILRVLKSPRWHGFNQAFSAALALLGVFLGIYAATMYNRTRSYNNAHQIFGIVIILAMIAQFVIGFQHHRIYKRTQAPTKLAPYHIWLGRIVIPAGIVNGFLGFPLALNPKYNWALVALCLLMVIIFGPIVFWRWRRDANKRKNGLGMASDSDEGYHSQPWNAGQSSSNINLGNYGGQQNYPPQSMNYPPPNYETPQQGRQFV